MKVLFVCSGNHKGDVTIIVKNQAESLKNIGIEIEYFTIKGNGTCGYLKNALDLKRFLTKNKYDIVHAHYSMSGFVAGLSGAKPLIVSLMGSDIYSSLPWNKFIFFFYKFIWDAVIVKSLNLQKYANLKMSHIIPNGVDLLQFKPINKLEAKLKVGFLTSKKYILFIADPKRKEKNFTLAKEAVGRIKNINIELFVVSEISNSLIPYYMNAADALLLTSFWEGSVNVVKEAMACNLSIVSTDVGDVKENIGNIIGCYITTYDADDIAEKLKSALSFDKPINSREKIISLGYDSETIALKILNLYNQFI